jgi:hypothetical protein
LGGVRSVFRPPVIVPWLEDEPPLEDCAEARVEAKLAPPFEPVLDGFAAVVA